MAPDAAPPDEPNGDHYDRCDRCRAWVIWRELWLGHPDVRDYEAVCDDCFRAVARVSLPAGR